MKYRKLGSSELEVSEICLGTMTWGEQNSEAEGHQQMDYATGQGVNFFDTAEMYPVPPKPDTFGSTEKIIGSWLKKNGNRNKLILATKVAGRQAQMPWFRSDLNANGGPTLSRENILQAAEASLERLQTDYIDLYQLHWPDRRTNFFGQLGYRHSEADSIALEESLGALSELVNAGKVRYVGLSNETPWGVMRFTELADSLNLPRVTSIQNPYNLLNRAFEVGLAEVAIKEQVPLLAYSPLAMGLLSGKYLNGQCPEGSRMALFERFTRYDGPIVESATQRYVSLAQDSGLDPAQMALAFVNQQPFIGSNIIGATTMAQLKSNICSKDVVLSDEIVREINKIHREIPNPAP
jgi:aryl-alcohol dehydrogenase-like predicted oxidoreductase